MRRSVVMLLLATAATSASARDLNRQNYLLGERAAGMGGAMVSLSGDAASAYYNPAGLGGLHRKGLSLSASAYQLAIEDTPKVMSWDTGGGVLRGDMSSSTFSTFPSSISYVLPLGEETNSAATRHVLAFSVFVPDYDKLAARFEMPVRDLAASMNGSILNTDSTYWIGPSYGVQIAGSLRLGLSLFALAHLTESQTKFGFKFSEDDGLGNTTNFFSTYARDASGTSLTALIQLGAQLDVTPTFTIGASVRSPTLGRLWSSVNMLELNSLMMEDGAGTPLAGSYADRIETTKGVTFEQRLPLMVAMGANYHTAGGFTVALDGTLHLAVAEYQRLRGPLAYPTDTSGIPILDDSRALDPNELARASQVLNANLGVELPLSAKAVGRLGLFTDFSTVDRALDTDPNHPKVTRFGASLGIGLKGERSTTSFGVVYTGGSGKATGVNDIFGAYGAPTNEATVTTHTVTAVLSGSADL